MGDFDDYAYLEQQLDQHRLASATKTEDDHGDELREKNSKLGSSRPRGEREERGSGRDRDRKRDYERGERGYRDDRDQRGYKDGRGEGHRGRGGGRDYDDERGRGRGRGGYGGRQERDGYRDNKRRSRSPKRASVKQDIAAGVSRVFLSRKSRTVRSRRDRDRTPPEVKAARAREEELMKLERDTRTVFAYNLNLKAEEKDIYMFFSQAGTVTDVKLITDRSTKKSKGFAYIEFAKQEEVLPALGLTGQMLLGQAVMVKMSEAEKNLAWEAQQAAAAAQNQQAQATAALISGAGFNSSAGPCKLHVSNLSTQITEVELKSMFDPIGAIDFIQVTRDPAGRSQGSAVVQYKTVGDASRAQAHWNGKELLGLELKITITAVNATDPVMGSLPELDEDDEPGGGLKFSSQARAALMSRLASSAGLQANIPIPGMGAAGGPPAVEATKQLVTNGLELQQGVLGPASPIPTPCVLLKNMFDPEQENEPQWDEMIAEDVKEEAGKYGSVLHVHVDKNSKGFVYLKFNTVEAASQAQAALHGRWFSGKQILAEFQFLAPYNNFFRC